IRSALTSLPDGSWSFTDVLDSAAAARVAVRLTVADDEAVFDFTGSSPQQRGNVNAVEAVTVSAVGFAVRAATDPSIPANGGALRPVHVVAPAGPVVAARPPAAGGAGNGQVGQRVGGVGLRGLGGGAPGGGRAQPLPAKVTLELDQGDVLRMRTPGGGGYGAPT